MSGQSQASLMDQLIELHRLAIKNGLYDAADWLARRRVIPRRKASDPEQRAVDLMDALERSLTEAKEARRG